MQVLAGIAGAILAFALAFAAGGAMADTKLKLVEVITSPERTETLKTLVEGYKSANPGVEVEIVSLPWGQAFEKFATMVAGGDIPDVVEAYVEAAAEKGYREVRLIHGKGRGVQRGRVQQILAGHPLVEEFFDAPPARGAWGATVARLRTEA